MADEWTIRRSGVVYAASTIRNLGYPEETLRQLEKAGYRLYRNGKLVKRADRQKGECT